MTLSNLTTEMQNLVLYQSEQNLKFLFLVITLALSCYYIFYHQPRIQTETPFFAVGILRLLATLFSWAFIFSSPFAFLLLNPNVSFYDLYTPFLWIYATIMMVMIFVMVVDFIYYAPLVMLKWAGVKSENKNVQRVQSLIDKMNFRK
jgi:hypothetical protein